MSFTSASAPATAPAVADRDEPPVSDPTTGPTGPTAPSPSPGAAPAADEQEERRTRRRRVATVEIPEEVHAAALLMGRDPAEMVQAMVAAQLAAVRFESAKALRAVLP